MEINKKMRKKIIASFAVTMALGIPFVQSIGMLVYSPTVQASNLTSLIGITGLGMKINSFTQYNYSMPKDLTAAIVCRATNDAAQNPTEGETGTYTCHVIKFQKDSRYIFPTGYTTGRLTYSGARSILTLQLGYTKVTGYKNGNPLTENGSIPITIKAETVRSTSTAITDSTGVNPYNKNINTIDGSTSTVYPGGLPDLSGNGGTKPDGWDNSDSTIKTNTGEEGSYFDGHGPCTDGTYFCPEETGDNNPFIGNGSNNGNGGTKDNWPTNNGSTNDIISGGITTPGGLGEGDGLKKDPGTQSFTKNEDNTPNYGDVINDMLGDNSGSSYNSPNIDWSSSTGNSGDTGESNLDDYFNGIDDTDTLPDAITVDEELDDISENPAEDISGYADNGTNNADNNYAENNAAYTDSENPSGSNSAPLGDFDAIPNEYQSAAAALDGSGDKDGEKSTADGIFGDMGDGSSLKDKIKELFGGDKTVSGNKKGGATEQDLFDYAKKYLLANGYTAADIASGKNYDDGSAYTEPVASWDMNRITTLIRGKKISLTNPSEIKNSQSEGNALRNVSKASITGVNDKKIDTAGNKMQNTGNKESSVAKAVPIK